MLWAPVLTELPGRQPLSAVGRGGYLIVQSIVPSFLSVVWIFAHRPLYSSYDHHARSLGMSPVLDQQLAGFLAKLSTIAVLWTVAFTLMTRAQVTAGTDEDAEPLIWSDVEREIERADRRDQRAPPTPSAPTPPDVTERTAPPSLSAGRAHDPPWRRSGQCGSLELLERQLCRLVAPALRALLDVAPRTQQAGPPGIQEHHERFGDGVDLQAVVGPPAPSWPRGVASAKPFEDPPKRSFSVSRSTCCDTTPGRKLSRRTRAPPA